MWPNDSFQVAFDPKNDGVGVAFAGKTGYGADDTEFGIALTPLGTQTFQWAGAPEGGGRVVPNALLVVVRKDDYTIYEWAIPWKCVSKLPMRSGMVFGFNAVLLDSDQKGKTARYWMGLTPGICGGKDPSAFHDFILTE